MNTCECFNLETKEWKSIHSLPQASYCVLATVLNKEIILSGCLLNCLYSYNGSAYTNILALPVNTYKIVYEGWIFASSIPYENQEKNNTKWIPYNINNTWNMHLWVYTIFKQRENLYFIDTSNLMRINTKLKKLENIPYS